MHQIKGQSIIIERLGVVFKIAEQFIAIFILYRCLILTYEAINQKCINKRRRTARKVLGLHNFYPAPKIAFVTTTI